MTSLHFRTIAAMAIFTFATSAVAQDSADRFALPPVVKDLIDCRSIADPAQRLVCYDQRTDGLAQAHRSGEIIVADRKEVREERRGLFGISLPKLKIFGGEDGGEEPSSFEGVIKTVSGSRTAVVLELETGGTWAQTDRRYAGFVPVPGQKITIRRAALGSYMARVENKGGFRAKRVQ